MRSPGKDEESRRLRVDDVKAVVNAGRSGPAGTLTTYGVLHQFDRDKIYPTILEVFTAYSSERGVD